MGESFDHRPAGGSDKAANVVPIYPQPYGSGLLGDVKCDFASPDFCSLVPHVPALACADGQRLVSRLEAYLTYFFAVFFTALADGFTAALALPLAGASSGISLPAMGDPSRSMRPTLARPRRRRCCPG